MFGPTSFRARCRHSSTRVSIGDVDGALSSDATIRNITISDRDGVWFRLDRVRCLAAAALLSRRLEIDKLEIGKLEILGRPILPTRPCPARISRCSGTARESADRGFPAARTVARDAGDRHGMPNSPHLGRPRSAIRRKD